MPGLSSFCEIGKMAKARMVAGSASRVPVDADGKIGSRPRSRPAPDARSTASGNRRRRSVDPVVLNVEEMQFGNGMLGRRAKGEITHRPSKDGSIVEVIDLTESDVPDEKPRSSRSRSRSKKRSLERLSLRSGFIGAYSRDGSQSDQRSWNQKADSNSTSDSPVPAAQIIAPEVAQVGQNDVAKHSESVQAGSDSFPDENDQYREPEVSKGTPEPVEWNRDEQFSENREAVEVITEKLEPGEEENEPVEKKSESFKSSEPDASKVENVVKKSQPSRSPWSWFLSSQPSEHEEARQDIAVEQSMQAQMEVRAQPGEAAKPGSVFEKKVEPPVSCASLPKLHNQTSWLGWFSFLDPEFPPPSQGISPKSTQEGKDCVSPEKESCTNVQNSSEMVHQADNGARQSSTEDPNNDESAYTRASNIEEDAKIDASETDQLPQAQNQLRPQPVTQPQPQPQTQPPAQPQSQPQPELQPEPQPQPQPPAQPEPQPQPPAPSQPKPPSRPQPQPETPPQTPRSKPSPEGDRDNATANVASIAEGLPRPSLTDEDESAVSSKLFGDLKSLPSKEDASTLAGSSTFNGADHVADLDGRDDKSSIRHENVAAIVEKKVMQMNVPEAMPTYMDSSQKRKKSSDMTIEARRQLLVKELRSAMATFGRYDIRCANISAALGDLQEESKEYDQAVRLHKESVMVYSAKLGDDHSTTLNAKTRLANVLESAGEYDEAINTYYLVTVMRRALKGEKDPSAADGLVCMAHALRKKGEYQQAIKELKRALKIYRESLGDAHEKVSTTVDEIASLYVTIGDFEKSAAILEEVVKLKAATMGMKSDAVAETLITLATTYECSEQFSKAMKSLKKAYKIYTETEGYSSENATATLNRIAQLYEATGDFNRASIAYLGVLRGRKINLGEEDLQVGETYYKLGHALRETGQLEKALKCMKEALPIFVGKGVEMHDVEMIAEVMHEMALINKDKNHFHESARILKQELSVRRKIGQPEFPLIARTLNHLGMAEFQMRNNNKALKYLVEALTIFQERGEQGVDCADVLHNTGLVFEAVRNKERALEAFVEAARILKDHGYESSHPQVQKVNERIQAIQANKRGSSDHDQPKRRWK